MRRHKQPPCSRPLYQGAIVLGSRDFSPHHVSGEYDVAALLQQCGELLLLKDLASCRVHEDSFGPHATNEIGLIMPVVSSVSKQQMTTMSFVSNRSIRSSAERMPAGMET